MVVEILYLCSFIINLINCTLQKSPFGGLGGWNYMYDLIIIGGGPAGYVAAERAGHKGLKVLLFEKKSMGVFMPNLRLPALD